MNYESLLSKLLSRPSSVEEDVSVLENLRTLLAPEQVETTADDVEEQWLRGDVNCSPFPGKSPESIFVKQNDLSKFTFYLFERRYGWSEHLSHSTTGSELDLPRISQEEKRSSVILKSPTETLSKARLNELLDEFLKWYVGQTALSKEILLALKYTISQATSLPVVRNQTFVHFLQWLKLTSEHGIAGDIYPIVESLLVSGMSDVWSAIRNTCANRLSQILDSFSLQQVQNLFLQLVEICQCKGSSWQAKEGSVMGMAIIIRNFQWNKSTLAVGEDNSPNYLKFSAESLKGLPDFITASVSSVLYSLLAHPQLSIREHATKAFSAILSRCEFQEALLVFQEVVARLCKGTGALSEDSTIVKALPHHAVFKQGYEFLDAYEAEGLLGVCVFLIKHIPSGFLLASWPLYFSTFNLYLMHPASTVRQATSGIFKILVTMQSSNPVILKIVLNCLAANWCIDMDLLTRSFAASAWIQTPSVRSYNDFELSAQASLASEECSYPQFEDEDKLSSLPPSGNSSARHSPDVFRIPPSPPPSPDINSMSVESGSDYGQITSSVCTPFTRSRSGSSPSLKPKRIGIQNASKVISDMESNPDSVISESWEWREGRLLAFELVLKFLITNHIHYLFPSYILPTSRLAAVSSVDETLLSRKSASAIKDEENLAGPSLSGVMEGPSYQELEYNSYNVPLHRSSSSQGFDKSSEGSAVKKAKRAYSLASSAGSLTLHLLTRQNSMSQYMAPLKQFKKSKANKHMASSLLSQTKMLDAEFRLDNVPDSPKLDNKNMISFPYLETGATTVEKKPPSSSDENCSKILHSCVEFCLSDIESSERTEAQWINSVHLESMSVILKQILLETIESLADSRWELRRMAQQVLPLVTEAVRWFDITILEDIWSNYLTRSTTLLCYGGCVTMAYSISHAAKLVKFLNQPPASWKDPESCGRAALTVVSAIERGLVNWLPLVHNVLKQPCYDKMTVVSIEIILLTHTHFPKKPSDYEKTRDEENSVFECLHSIFMHSHSDSASIPALESSPFFAGLPPFISPLEGFLKCFKSDSQISHQQQVEKYLLSQIHPHLPAFFKRASLDHSVMTVPLLINFVGTYCQDGALIHSLIQSLLVILNKVKDCLEYSRTHCECDMTVPLIYQYFDVAIEEFCCVVNEKTMELSLLRQMLDILFTISTSIDEPRNLDAVFSAISSRLDFEPDLVKLMVGDDDLDHVKDLQMLSNDIPTTPVDETVILDDEDDFDESDDDNGRVLPESQALNSTPDSLNREAILSHGTPDGTDSLSDWDSWEEEEEDQSALTATFYDFLLQLQKYYTKNRIHGLSIFDETLKRCGDVERRVILSILEQKTFKL